MAEGTGLWLRGEAALTTGGSSAGSVSPPHGCCTIFVRLWQFRDGDRAQIVRRPGEGRAIEPRPGAASATDLFDDGHEDVRLEDWAAGATVAVSNRRGLEFLVLSGGLTVGGEALEPQSWGRLPAGTGLEATVGPQGAQIWIKEAPLLHPDVCRLPE